MKLKSTLFFLFFLISAGISNKLKAQSVNVQDSLALVDLYNSTNGPEWYYHTNWLTGPVSKWVGITVTGNRVTSISFINNNLTGNIPSSLGNLSNLITLILASNQLSGNIPPELGDLSNLSTLSLYANQLSGSIPPELGKLMKLNSLSLFNNQLSGSIPPELGKLINLHALGLAINQLSGNIPPELGNLFNLSSLTLYDNQLSGIIPSELSNLKYLIDLDLHSNRLSGAIPPQLGGLVNLSYLALNYNQLSGSVPPGIGNLTNLSFLFLHGNQLSGNIPSELGNLSILDYLYLNDNQLSGNIPTELGNLSNLEYLYLNNNQFGGSIPPELGNLRRIKSLYLNNNHLSGKIPSLLLNIGKHRLINLSVNSLIFDGLEQLVQYFKSLNYAPQATIPVHQNTNTLFTSAGGTLSNNTYKWFRLGQADFTTIVGDSVFYPSKNGKYYASVTNSVCTQLTLYTDTVDYESALPVTVINLEAQQQESSIKIGWSSLTETNITSYEIQRSANANNFSMVGVLPAKGNGTQLQNYNFNDLQPLAGNNYYRLKIIDKDGTATYSKMVLVNIGKDKAITLVYPIPAKDVLHIQSNESATFSLINQNGKVLFTKVIYGNGVINVSGIAEGMYYLKNTGTGAVQKIIISR